MLKYLFGFFRMLHSLMPISRMENKCAFINPQEITEPRCEYDDEYGTEHVIKHLVDVMKFHEKKQFFLAPYWKRYDIQLPLLL